MLYFRLQNFTIFKWSILSQHINKNDTKKYWKFKEFFLKNVQMTSSRGEKSKNVGRSNKEYENGLYELLKKVATVFWWGEGFILSDQCALFGNKLEDYLSIP
jgi:hypothetical protein